MFKCRCLKDSPGYTGSVQQMNQTSKHESYSLASITRRCHGHLWAWVDLYLSTLAGPDYSGTGPDHCTLAGPDHSGEGPDHCTLAGPENYWAGPEDSGNVQEEPGLT